MHEPHPHLTWPPPAAPGAPIDRPSEPWPKAARPVLAVVGDEGRYRGVLDRAVTLAARWGAALHVVVPHQPVRLTTDPALVAYVERRLAQRLAILRADIEGQGGSGCPASVQVLTCTGSLLCDYPTAVWRAVDALAEAVDARAVVAPWELRRWPGPKPARAAGSSSPCRTRPTSRLRPGGW